MDEEGLLRVGGRIELGKLAYTKSHPILLAREHRVVELLTTYEHHRLLYARPTLVTVSLAQRFVSYVGVAQYTPRSAIVLRASVSEQEPSRSY